MADARVGDAESVESVRRCLGGVPDGIGRPRCEPGGLRLLSDMLVFPALLCPTLLD